MSEMLVWPWLLMGGAYLFAIWVVAGWLYNGTELTKTVGPLERPKYGTGERVLLALLGGYCWPVLTVVVVCQLCWPCIVDALAGALERTPK